MGTSLWRGLIGCAAAVTLLTAQPASAQWALTCTRDPLSSVNLRRSPSTKAGVIASIPNSSEVRLLSWVYGADGLRWWRVENGGLVGWARSDYLCR